MPNEFEDPQPVDETGYTGHPKPELPQGQTSIVRTLISLLLYLGVFYLIFNSWYAVAVLAVVVIFHELGHLAAMKICGYKSLNMTFIPFVGAYVSGATDTPSRFKRCMVLLAGPVPGIVLGCFFYYAYVTTADDRLFYPGILFLFVNVFNLIPVVPLDGGQLMENLYLNRSGNLQLLFLNLSLLCLGLTAVHFQQFSLLIFMLPIMLRITNVNLKYRVRRLWDEYDADYHKLWNDLSDDDYWHLRDVLVGGHPSFSRYTSGQPAENEYQLAMIIRAFLSPAAKNDVSPARRTVFTLVWLIALIVPVLLVMYYKGVL